MAGTWKLEGFEDWVRRWVAQEAPPAALQAKVIDWLLTELRVNAFPPGSVPVGDNFPITWWFVRMPFGRDDNSRVVCTYEISMSARVLVCKGLAELSLPI